MALSVPYSKKEEKKKADFISLWEDAANKAKREAYDKDRCYREANEDDPIARLFR